MILMHIRNLAANETGLARALLERMGADDQLHHFQCIMTAIEFDLWEERARRHRLIGSFDRSHLVGLAEIAHFEDRAECSMWVDVEHRRRGIGTALFEQACVAARESGAKTLMVLVTRGDAEMLDMAVRHDGLSIYRHGKSMILPEGDYATARWLVFELGVPPPENWFGHAIRSVREILALRKSEH